MWLWDLQYMVQYLYPGTFSVNTEVLQVLRVQLYCTLYSEYSIKNAYIGIHVQLGVQNIVLEYIVQYSSTCTLSSCFVSRNMRLPWRDCLEHRSLGNDRLSRSTTRNTVFRKSPPQCLRRSQKPSSIAATTCTL